MTSNVVCYFASSYLTCRGHAARERKTTNERVISTQQIVSLWLRVPRTSNKKTRSSKQRWMSLLNVRNICSELYILIFRPFLLLKVLSRCALCRVISRRAFYRILSRRALCHVVFCVDFYHHLGLFILYLIMRLTVVVRSESQFSSTCQYRRSLAPCSLHVK